MIVKFIKMKNGEEFVGEYIEAKVDSLTINNPVILHQGHDANGQPQSGFIPWCAFAKEREFVFDTSDIMFCVDATDNISQAYNEAYGTIIKPNAPQIITG